MDAKSSNKTATLTVGNKTYDFPILSGTVGPDVIDIAKLYAQAGMFTYDPGFTSTGSCQSKITYIDGDAGILEYRGYPIEQLAEKGDFLETCYLLLYGELPTPAQKKDFDSRVIHHTMVHEQMARFFQGFRRDAHPMAIMVAAVGALAAFYHDSTDINDPKQRMIASMRMIAKVPTLAAMAFKYTIGQPFMYPKNSLSFAENFLHMCFAVPCEDYKINPVLADALDKIFILHADHEQNASTSTVRIAGSSGANPFACIAAGIACLWGPAHGGANEAALAMLADIGTVDKIPEFIKKVKDKNSRSPPDGLWSPRLQELRSARQDHAEDVSRRAGRDRPWRRSDAEGGAGAGKDRAQRPVLHRPQALPERRLLFGHHAEGDGLPDLDVHRAVRGRPHRRLDQPVERDDRGPAAEDRPSAPALHRRRAAATTWRWTSGSKRWSHHNSESRMRSSHPAFLFLGLRSERFTSLRAQRSNPLRRKWRCGLLRCARNDDLLGGTMLDWKLPVRKRRVRSRRRARDDRSLPLPHLPQDAWIGFLDRHQRPARPLSLDQG